MFVEPCDGIRVRHSFEWPIGGSKLGVERFHDRGGRRVGKDLVDRLADLSQCRSKTVRHAKKVQQTHDSLDVVHQVIKCNER